MYVLMFYESINRGAPTVNCGFADLAAATTAKTQMQTTQLRQQINK